VRVDLIQVFVREQEEQCEDCMQQQRRQLELRTTSFILENRQSPQMADAEDEKNAAAAADDLEIFILSGQSNMSGRGGLQSKRGADGHMHKVWDGIVPQECDAEPGSILRLTATLEWEEAHEPLHHDIDTGKPTGVGPGLVFAASLLRSHDSVAKSEEKQPRKKPAIGLVPCAVGGTTMSEWKKGGFLYDRMIQRTKVAIEKGGTLKALLWYQGESDTTSKASGASFGSKLATFLQDVRTDLQSPDFPIIQVGIQWGHHPQPAILEEVRQAQIAAADPSKHVYIVDALGLPLQSDNLHLTTEAQTTLGLMLVEKYISVITESS
jgi:hypothetical protein